MAPVQLTVASRLAPVIFFRRENPPGFRPTGRLGLNVTINYGENCYSTPCKGNNVKSQEIIRARSTYAGHFEEYALILSGFADEILFREELRSGG
jgi:hypothetical protein